MYWCKSRCVIFTIVLGGIALTGLLPSCKPETKEAGASLKYFDLKGFIDKEAKKLTKQNKPVLKSVSHNGIAESKKVHIDDWDTELSVFKEADINRPAWKDSYSIVSDGNFLIYKTLDSTLTTREILIKKENQKVEWIMIINRTKNKLYLSTEKLSYFPDSLYLIEKYQRIRFMGTNNYKIEGRITR